MKYELSKEQVNIIFEMADICLKTGGLKNLPAVVEIVSIFQEPIKDILNDKCNQQSAPQLD